MTAAIDITAEQRKMLLALLRRFIPGVAVWAYGSRVKWTARPNSDLDLVAFTTPEQRPLVSELKELLDESNLPFLVDFHVWDEVPERFREIIRKEYVVLQKAEEKREGIGAGDALFPVVRGDWDWQPLSEVCRRGGGDIQTGPFGSQLHAADYVPFGVPSIMPQNISQDRVNTDGIARITPQDAERLSRYLLRAGDIVYSRRGDVERRALITEQESGWLCGTGCLRIRFGDGVVIPKFAAYFLSHPASREWIVRHAVGATMPNLNTSILEALPFLLPPLPEQHAIAGVLGSLDDKIESNRRTSRVLERLARAIFRAWFVDFAPVKAKAAGARSFPGMPQETFDALPERLVDSELGPVPEGWGVLPLGKLIELAYGKPLKAEDRKTGAVRVYGANGPIGWHDEKLVSGPGIVVGRKGNPGVVTWVSGDFYPIDTTFYVVTIGGCRSLYFLYYALLFHDLANLSADSAVPGLNRNQAYMSKQLVPKQEVLEVFDSQISPIFAAINANEQQSRTLAALRDYLLPKLLSGEVRVAEADSVSSVLEHTVGDSKRSPGHE